MWANNPDYTMHATSTKPEIQHKSIFGMFENNGVNSIEEESSRRSSNASFLTKPSKPSSIELSPDESAGSAINNKDDIIMSRL